MVFETENQSQNRSTQTLLLHNHPDRIQIAFDDDHLVANAGLLLPVTLAQRLGLRELVDSHVDLGNAPGRANTGDKMMTPVASALAGGDCIDDADVLRTGGTTGAIGCAVKAPSTPAFARAGSGDLSAQLPLGPRPPAEPGGPRVAGPGLGGWGRTRRRTMTTSPGRKPGPASRRPSPRPSSRRDWTRPDYPRRKRPE